MPGTFILKPIEANLTHNTDLIGRMNPYCSFIVGNTKIKSQVCKKGGKYPHWNDAVTLPVTLESKVMVDLMDKDKLSHDDMIGSFVLDLNEVQSVGQVHRWYPLTYKNKNAGEILLEAIYRPDSLHSNQYYEQEPMHSAVPQQTKLEEEVINPEIAQPSHVWTEQRQIVEPHTFMKEVEVVETRPALKEIEVMEPVKVVKDVQVTEAVPVKKQIEVAEPQVVTKEVEVIEPKLVTKTIQVVENVPVKKQVEVVELKNTTQEVETVEPQTATKQVEVTEYVPVKQQVEVTQPVTVNKAVECVEPVITTQTITKEVQQPVIIDEKVTTEVGPVGVVGMSKEYGFGDISPAERQRLNGLKRWIGYETIFGGLNEKERLWEMMRLSRLSEEEWIKERERLMAFKEQERLAEQRRLFGQEHSVNHHISH